MNTIVKLADIAHVIRGISFDKSDVVDEPKEGYSAVLRAGNIEEYLILDDDLVWIPKSKVSDLQLIRKDDIAMCMSSGSPRLVGKTAISPSDFNGGVGAFCSLIRAIPEVCHPIYLAYFFKSSKFRKWTSESQGANIKNIKKSELEAYEIDLPNMTSQLEIVKSLETLEDLRSLKRRLQIKESELLGSVLDKFFN